MGVQVSFGFGNLRLILRAAEGHTTGGGTDDSSLTEAVVKDTHGSVLGRRLFADALAMVEQVCPGIVIPGQTLADLPQDSENKQIDEDHKSKTRPQATLPEGIEYLGTYPTLAAYLRAMLEPEVSAPCVWILDHLDYKAVQFHWESDGSRLIVTQGHVYRLAAHDGSDATPTR